MQRRSLPRLPRLFRPPPPDLLLLLLPPLSSCCRSSIASLRGVNGLSLMIHPQGGGARQQRNAERALVPYRGVRICGTVLALGAAGLYGLLLATCPLCAMNHALFSLMLLYCARKCTSYAKKTDRLIAIDCFLAWKWGMARNRH